MTRGYGWIPDIPDARDKPLSVKPRMALPRKVDNRAYDTPIENQRGSNSCVGQAVIAAVEHLDNMDGEYTDASPSFPYYNARLRRGWENRDEGAYIRDAIKSMASEGVCSNALHPFSEADINKRPSDKAYEDGKKKPITDYYRIDFPDRLYKVKYAMASRYPIVFGFTVYRSLNQSDASRTGFVPLPQLDNPNESEEGGHANKGSGYDDDLKWNGVVGHVFSKNSWGAGHGDNGYLYIPYPFFEDENLLSDIWVITKGGFIDGDFAPMRWYSRVRRFLRRIFF